MATAANSAAGYEGSAGAGGKFRKRPFRRNQTTPYDRPPTALRPTQVGGERNGWLSKLVDPASKLITAGAHKLFASVFRKQRLLPPPPPPPPHHPPDENKETRNVQLEGAIVAVPCGTKESAVCRGNDLSRNLDSNGVAELEGLLKQKTFTRSEIDHLTALLISRTADDSVGAEKGRSEEKFSELQHGRHEKLAELPVHGNGVEPMLPGAMSTPVTRSKVLEDDVASPAELAKAYMGSRPTRVSPSVLGLQNQMHREDASAPYNPLFKPRPQATSLFQKPVNDAGTSENGFVTPRFRGRSAIYSMARTPYSRIHSTAAFKAAETIIDARGGASSSNNAMENNQFSSSKKQALKRRSSVLENDIGSVGPIRRIRQKPNLLHPKILTLPASGGPHLIHGSGDHPGVAEEPSSLDWGSRSRSSSKALVDNSKPSTSSGYVPSQSIEMAQKIFQQLDKITPKRKSPEMKNDIAGENSPGKMTPSMLGGLARKSMETVDSSKLFQNIQDSRKDDGSLGSDDAHGPLPKISLKAEEASHNKFVVPSENMARQNGIESAVPTSHSSRITEDTHNVVPQLGFDRPQKKRAFQMSAYEDSLELDDDSNGVASTPSSEKGERAELSKKAAAIPNSPPRNEASAVMQPPVPEESPTKNSFLSQKEPESLSDRHGAAKDNAGFTFSVVPSSSPATSTSMLAVGSAAQSTSESDKRNETSYPFPAFSSKSDKLPAALFSTSSSVTESAVPKDTKTELPSSVNDVADKANGPEKTNEKSNQEVTDAVRDASSVMSSAKGAFSFGPPANSTTFNNGLPSTGPGTSAALSPTLFSSSLKNQSSIPVTFSASSESSNLSNGFAGSSSTSSAAAVGTTVGSTFTSSAPASRSNMSSSATTPSVSAGSIFQFGNSASQSTAPSFSSGSTFLFGSPAVPSTAATLAASASESAENAAGAKSTAIAFGGAAAGSLFSTKASTVASESNGISGFSASNLKSASSEAQPQAAAAPAGTSGSLFGFQASSSSSSSSSSLTQSFPSQPAASSSSSPIFGLSGPTNFASGASMFGSSTPAANPFSSGATLAASSSSSMSSSVSSTTSNTAPSIFGSSWQPSQPTIPGSTFSGPTLTPTFTFGLMKPSTDGGNSSSSSSSAPFIFGSSVSSTAAAAAPVASFPSSSSSLFPSQPPVFAFGATPTLGNNSNNNDQMSMEDSMAEDSVQASAPAAAAVAAPPTSLFGAPPIAAAPPPASGGGFVFGAAPPSNTGGSPFQFGGQMAPQSPSPLQPSGSLDFNAGGAGSFSLGTGGGDKSNRRIVKVKSKLRKK